MDQGILEQVKELKASGLKRKEIAGQLHISIRKVDRAIAELKKIPPSTITEDRPPPTSNQGITEERLREVIREELEQKDTTGARLPAVLKTGKGQEVISPEGIMQQYLLGDGDHGVAMLEGMMLLRAAQLMVLTDVEIMKGQADAQATAIKPILEVMETAREDMDAAAERARASTAEVAEAAAGGAAARATMHIDERFDEMMRQNIAQAPNPMLAMMTQAMQPMLQQALSGLMGVFTPKPGHPQSGAQPGETEQSDAQQPGLQPSNPPPHMKPGEENQWTEV